MRLSALRRPAFAAALAAVLTLAASTSCKEKDPGPQPFPLPTVPGMMAAGADYQDYLVSHFWQPFFDAGRKYSTDTSLVGGVSPDAFTSAFTDYAALLISSDVDKGLREQEYLMAEAEKMQAAQPDGKVLETVLKLSEAVLYNPNSFLRNEEMYIPVQEAILNSRFTTEAQKADAAALLPRLSLNRLGTQAADFGFTRLDGRKSRLYDVKADYTILLFSNPGCEDCKAVIDLLSSLEGIDSYIAAGNLAVVNIYPDADRTQWRSYAPIYPANWNNGFNEAMDVAGGLYNLRAIPSLYLLDKDKEVILKDVDVNVLVSYLTALAADR